MPEIREKSRKKVPEFREKSRKVFPRSGRSPEQITEIREKSGKEYPQSGEVRKKITRDRQKARKYTDTRDECSGKIACLPFLSCYCCHYGSSLSLLLPLPCRSTLTLKISLSFVRSLLGSVLRLKACTGK